MRVRSLLSAALLAASLTIAGGASADGPGAKQFVENEHGTIKKLVENGASKDDIRNEIDKMVSYKDLVERTLGDPCPILAPNCTSLRSKLSDDQYNRVSDLMRKLVEKNYHKNLNKTKEYDVTYGNVKEASENVNRVRTEAKNKTKPRDPAVQVDYVVIQKGDRYWVIDIITEGSSMTKNYYDQFKKMLDNPEQGPEFLIGKLQKKVDAPAKEAEQKSE